MTDSLEIVSPYRLEEIYTVAGAFVINLFCKDCRSVDRYMKIKWNEFQNHNKSSKITEQDQTCFRNKIKLVSET